MKKLKIPTPIFSLLIVLGIVILFIWGWIVVDYVAIRSSLINIDSDKKVYEEQEKKVKKITSRLNLVEFEFERIKELNHRLRVLTSLESRNASTAKQNQLLEKIRRSKGGILSAISIKDTNIRVNREEQLGKLTNLKKYIGEEKVFYSNTPNSWPVRGLLISGFGYRSDPLSGQLRPHHGIDVATKLYSPIYAPANGIVIQLKKDEYLGNIIVIKHSEDLITKYAHVADPDLKVGQLIKKNEIIAKVGNTGKSAGSHLHYEVIFNHIPQNPINYIQN